MGDLLEMQQPSSTRIDLPTTGIGAGLDAASAIPLKVAIVHYWLVGMRGGEKVVAAMCRMWPEADIYTHVYDPASIAPAITEHRVRTTFIQKLPFAKKFYKKYLPLMPYALEKLDLTAYDLVVSSESGPAKGVVIRPDAFHICYCHSPMRYIWDHAPLYRAASGRFTRFMMDLFLPSLRQWDYLSASRVDQFLANSSFVRQRIRKFYRRDAVVLHPPVDTAFFTPGDGAGDYYLAFGQLVKYKRFDIAVEAFTKLGRKLIVVGTGEEAPSLQKIAGPTIEFRGSCSNEQVRELLRGCKALIFPGEEDFGIVPVEAMACGRPVIAFGSGGALETVVDGVTGVLFHEQTAKALTRAISRFEALLPALDPAKIRTHAEAFGEAFFIKGLEKAVADLTCKADDEKRQNQARPPHADFEQKKELSGLRPVPTVVA